jgi:hypothetical protein
LNRRLSGPQNRSGHYGEEKNFATAGNRTPSVQLVTVVIPTELSRLLNSIYMDAKQAKLNQKKTEIEENT